MQRLHKWNIEKYAKRVSPKADDWEVFHNDTKRIFAHLGNGQFIVTIEKCILESLNLNDGEENMRGVAKGDSLLIIIKTVNMTRQFKMKFLSLHGMSPTEHCQNCAQTLANYFSVRIDVPIPNVQKRQITLQKTFNLPMTEGTPATLSGEVTLSDIAESVLSDSKRLPDVYTRLGVGFTSSTDLDTYIRMCLSDATFPAFVAQVEDSLKSILVSEQ